MFSKNYFLLTNDLENNYCSVTIKFSIFTVKIIQNRKSSYWTKLHKLDQIKKKNQSRI